MTEHSGECAARNRDQCRRGRITTSASQPRPPSATAMKVFLSRSQSALPPKMLLATDATFSATPGASPGDVDDFVAAAPPDELSDVVAGSSTGAGLLVDVALGTTEELVDDVVEPTESVLVGALVAAVDVDVVDVVVGGVSVEVVVDVGGV